MSSWEHGTGCWVKAGHQMFPSFVLQQLSAQGTVRGQKRTYFWLFLQDLSTLYLFMGLLPTARSIAPLQSPAKGRAKLYYTDNYVELAEEIFSGEPLEYFEIYLNILTTI